MCSPFTSVPTFNFACQQHMLHCKAADFGSQQWCQLTLDTLILGKDKTSFNSREDRNDTANRIGVQESNREERWRGLSSSLLAVWSRDSAYEPIWYCILCFFFVIYIRP